MFSFEKNKKETQHNKTKSEPYRLTLNETSGVILGLALQARMKHLLENMEDARIKRNDFATQKYKNSVMFERNHYNKWVETLQGFLLFFYLFYFFFFLFLFIECRNQSNLKMCEKIHDYDITRNM